MTALVRHEKRRERLGRNKTNFDHRLRRKRTHTPEQNQKRYQPIPPAVAIHVLSSLNVFSELAALCALCARIIVSGFGFISRQFAKTQSTRINLFPQQTTEETEHLIHLSYLR